jgi:thiamine-monophosphate kinase
MLSEFELIARYFSVAPRHTALGVGDDAALIAPRAGWQLAVSTDMLVEGAHFHSGADPAGLGHKCLAVNLSDMAAMGAIPRWAFLSLALPDADEVWIRAFACGFLALAGEYDVDLAGGDTTRGPRNVCVTIVGEVEAGKALRRDGARPGDDVWLSGVTGEAAVGLAVAEGRVALAGPDAQRCRERLERPQPRVALGRALSGVATAAIDVSDGLLADLGHVCERSRVGARVEWSRLPASSALSACDVAMRRAAVLSGGDDYELCFCAPPSRRALVLEASRRSGTPVTRIGCIVAGGGASVLDPEGVQMNVETGGFDHFA